MIYIFIAMLFYAVAILFGAAASRNANTNLVAAITNLVSAIVPIAVIVPIVGKKMITNNKFGVVLAVMAGISIAIFAMSIAKAYSVNKVGIVAPIIFGGALFLSTIASYFIFKEKISGMQAVGLTILAVGFGIIIYARATGK
jgi:drug/metabolite transporter (DMT)-like permease